MLVAGASTANSTSTGYILYVSDVQQKDTFHQDEAKTINVLHLSCSFFKKKKMYHKSSVSELKELFTPPEGKFLWRSVC